VVARHLFLALAGVVVGSLATETHVAPFVRRWCRTRRARSDGGTLCLVASRFVIPYQGIG
jgi:hypothetical protein